MKPIVADERIQLLDIARGLAILGILFVNITFYSSSLQAIQYQIELWPDFWNQAVKKFLDIVITGKFIAIFAFLFGYGMILFKDRAGQKGRRFGALYSRRLLALLIFGLLHGWFIWFGDILVHYALLGFVLLIFHKCKPKTLLIWAILLIMLIPVLMLISSGESAATPKISPEFQQLIQQFIERDQAIYGSGSFAAIQQQRILDWYASVMNQLIFYPQILGLFLMGAYFAKRKLFHDLSANRPVLTKICLWTGGIGLTSILLPILLELTARTSAAGWIDKLNVFHYLLGSPSIGLFYITLLALLVRKKAWEQALEPLANVGRMAFTNYIMQSVLCTLIFYSYGLGWYGQVGPLTGSLIALIVFGLQLLFSALWLRRFKMGPLEWIWRTVTYLSVSPNRKKKLTSTL
ncbi:DUF418 domain-containing protein [Paenibacillus sp. J2TS4]|uniref:DUF418 domain-containing protein n=1 Tax=Paenibacillus sp. J2TS4 TaxID=2807194 RepID=UPI001B17C86B|nr:DUF418 domain-containing protein [Paenibacillus sp. J2TS4]GIP33806.1 hypothetical protein J2TS4_30160 [Paenibacillus sp. J2TS4]